jgi:hypothetical protein
MVGIVVTTSPIYIRISIDTLIPRSPGDSFHIIMLMINQGSYLQSVEECCLSCIILDATD